MSDVEFSESGAGRRKHLLLVLSRGEMQSNFQMSKNYKRNRKEKVFSPFHSRELRSPISQRAVIAVSMNRFVINNICLIFVSDSNVIICSPFSFRFLFFPFIPSCGVKSVGGPFSILSTCTRVSSTVAAAGGLDATTDFFENNIRLINKIVRDRSTAISSRNVSTAVLFRFIITHIITCKWIAH